MFWKRSQCSLMAFRGVLADESDVPRLWPRFSRHKWHAPTCPPLFSPLSLSLSFISVCSHITSTPPLCIFNKYIYQCNVQHWILLIQNYFKFFNKLNFPLYYFHFFFYHLFIFFFISLNSMLYTCTFSIRYPVYKPNFSECVIKFRFLFHLMWCKFYVK